VIAASSVGIASAAIWEMYEYVVRMIFGNATAHGDYADTMGDLLAGTVGALLASIFWLTSQSIRQGAPQNE
jgi:uncharacterized membrane protein YjdF